MDVVRGKRGYNEKIFSIETSIEWKQRNNKSAGANRKGQVLSLY